MWERHGGLFISDSLTALIRKQEIAVNLRRLEEDDLCYVCLCVIGCLCVLLCACECVREGEKRGEQCMRADTQSDILACELLCNCSWACIVCHLFMGVFLFIHHN